MMEIQDRSVDAQILAVDHRLPRVHQGVKFQVDI